MKKKILLGVVIFFAIHALTWWMWGTNRLLVKGYNLLEEKEECTRQFEQMTFSEVVDDSVYSYIGEKFWMTPISGVDSLFELKVNGVKRKVYSKNSEKWKGLLQESYSTNITYQVLGVQQEYANPYYQEPSYFCWALGSDYIIEHQPFLVWAFVGWIEVINSEEWSKIYWTIFEL